MKHEPGPIYGTSITPCVDQEGNGFFGNATFITQGCGCKVIGNGTLPHPIDIKYCSKHAAAAEMYKELQSSIECLDVALKSGHLTGTEYGVFKSRYDKAIAVIAKAEGK